MSDADDSDDLWDAGLFSAFESSEAAIPQTCGRFVLIEQIARGGIGTIHRARDERLERDVAIKRLRDEHVEDAAMVARFLTEARVAARLQHPGVVPVYDSGLDAANRPYLCMKLVEGRTLIELMKAESPDTDRLLDIFRRICGTVAFAHAAGIIHRDLKPSNVMIGAFGEILVVDWGFAKVLGDAAEESDGSGPSVEERRRGDSSSIAGSVLGTPAYMPPEQARGEIDALDERVDVFALGAMLCEMLTGTPPYDGDSTRQVLECAARGDLNDARRRLDAFEGDAQLSALCRECLSEDADGRPRHAGVVHERIDEWFTATLRERESARIAAASSAIQAREERKLRRVTTILATSVIALIIVGGALTWRESSRRGEAREAFHLAMSRFDERLDARDWAGARQAIDVAILHARRGRDQNGAARIRAARRKLDGLQKKAAGTAEKRARVEAFEAELSDIMTRGIDSPLDRDRELTLAFETVGVGVDRMVPGASVERLRELGIDIEAMVSLLDEWTALRTITRRRPAQRGPRPPRDRSKVLAEMAATLDPDVVRSGLRRAARAASVEELHALVEGVDVADVSPQTLVMLALVVSSRGEATLARALLEDAHHAHPGSFWINHHLAVMLGTATADGAAVANEDLVRSLHHAWLGLATAPESLLAREQVGRAMLRLNKVEDADRLLQATELIDTERAGSLRRRLMRTSSADVVLALCRRRLDVAPEDASTRAEYASRLVQVGAFDEACREARRCLESADAPRPAVRALLEGLLETGRFKAVIETARRFETPDVDRLVQEARRSLEFDRDAEIARGPREVLIHGLWHARSGRIPEAARVFAEVVERDARRPRRAPSRPLGPGGGGGPPRFRVGDMQADRRRTMVATLLAAAESATEPAASRYASLAVTCFLREIDSSETNASLSRRDLWRFDRRLQAAERILAPHTDLAEAWKDGMRRIVAH